MDVQAFLQQLPEDPPNGLIRWTAEAFPEEIGGEYTIFHNEYTEAPPEIQELMDNKTTGRKVWATFCTCTACGEEWVTKRGTTPESFWVVTGEDGATYSTEIGEDVGSCGMDYQEIGEGDAIICPLCWSKTTTLKEKSVRGGRTKRLQVAELRNVGNITTIFYWLVERKIYEYGTSLNAVPRYAYALDEKGRIKAFSHKEGGGGLYNEKQGQWHKLSNTADRWNAQYQDWNSINNRKAGAVMWGSIPLLEEMTGTTGEKTGLQKYWDDGGSHPVEYMKLWQKLPSVENLVNADFSGIIDGIVGSVARGYDWKTEAEKHLDITKKKPHEMLRLSKEDYKALPDHAGTSEIGKIREYRAIGGTLPVAEVLEKLKGVPADTLFGQMKVFGGTLEKYEHYMRKQRMGMREIQTLADARSFAMRLHPDRPPTEEELWPRDLIATHDRLTRQNALKINSEENAKLQAGFDAVLERFGPIQWTDKDLVVLLPKSNLDLVREGNTLNHCVGGYGGRHAGGQSIILFIRHYRRPERSYYTLNISFRRDTPKEVQLHGYGNERHGPHKQYTHTIPAKVRAFVDRWEKEILEPWWAQEMKKQKKEKSA